MKAPLSWIREHVDLPADVTLDALTWRLTMLGLKLEGVASPADDITGPLVLGRVLTREPEPQKNGKTISWCTVDVGEANGTGDPQGIVCGAHNFVEGDLVVVCLPGAVLPGGFAISARKTYGHVSAGMICSASELGLPDDAFGGADGIIVLPADAGAPGDDAFPVLGLGDAVIELEINPDRAYALSVRGIAREAALGFGAPYADPAARRVPAPNDAGHPVVVDDPAGCPVFVARTVTGFRADAPTPDWMARRLTQAGMRPISLGVDITNYVMLELGQPLHGYDRDKLTGAIRVRRATAGEQITTLDGQRRTLDVEDLLITDGSGPIGIAGTMGGETTELSGTTTNVVIESAHFDAVTVFRSGRRHKLPSEASKRFERGVDPELPQAAADRAVELMVELGGATDDAGVTVVGQAPQRRVVTIPADLPARISGLEIDAATVTAHLTAVGCDVTADGERLAVVAPSWRPDVTDPYDLVEEVVRVVGYDQVPSVLPTTPPGHGWTPVQRLRRRVGLTLAGAGWTETISYPFVGEDDWDRLGLPADDPRRTTLRMANPLNNEEPILTTTLLPGLLKALARNVGRANADVALFEHSLVCRPTGNERAPILGVETRPSAEEWATIEKAVPSQPMHLAVAVTGQRARAGWWGAGREGGWADAIGAVRDVARALGVEVEVRADAVAPWHPGRCAAVRIGERVIGHAGELHPSVCRAYGVPARTAVAEVDLDALLEQAQQVVPGPTFSSYPVAKEDVALVVDAAVPAAAVEAALREGAGELLESIRLFDVYTGPQVGEGRKSLAYALRFRAPDRTLTEAETAAAREAAVAVAAERTGAVQRA
ncbi:phenylalanine--tRNA ligase subunit beta [uncultured Nocardioides sp.]|uniref:Phenylalanine--tRNA ligase beta subunit n=1 Tax=uncultured Nocardioides sp. TaxID=198441 RepID=A0A6J4PGW7_9ACTN|nr:phenylalanine--tRNA ligase subunit beta [uncultured Nocardioides sp.]CAA9414343.1 MAG: Phenylalanyl-tRNA synthetase beta chain [uncultured Nocardioides sp.]